MMFTQEEVSESLWKTLCFVLYSSACTFTIYDLLSIIDLLSTVHVLLYYRPFKIHPLLSIIYYLTYKLLPTLL